MRSVIAVILTATLLISTLDAQVGTQSQKASVPGPDSSGVRSQGQSAPVVAQPRQQDYAPAERPIVLWECDMNQCVTGGGGAIWVFEGKRGEALWHVGAVADLTMESLDNRRIAVHRSDPLNSYSTKFTGGKVLTAEYTGAIEGKNIKDGKVVFGGNLPATWYGGITDGVCDVGEACPLAPHQLVQLGENSLNAKLYLAAFLCFKSAAGRGEYDGEAFAAIMLRDGAPGLRPDPAEAFRMLQDSAENDNVNGELALSQTYELGIGTRIDAEKAAFWKNRAVKRIQEIRAAQNQQLLGELLVGAVAVGAIFALFSGSGGGSTDREAESSSEKHNETERKKWLAREAEWIYRGGTGGPPMGWLPGDPVTPR